MSNPYCFILLRFSFQKQSKFNGVSWHKSIKKWTAFFTINGKSVYIGSSDNEIDCAKILNQKCVELGLKKRFPELDCLKLPVKKKKKAKVITNSFCKCIPFFFQKQSKYKPGVTWRKCFKKWEGRMNINGKHAYLGSSDNEIDCAKLINQKCVELGLKKRFPELGCLKLPDLVKSIYFAWDTVNIIYGSFFGFRKEERRRENVEFPFLRLKRETRKG